MVTIKPSEARLTLEYLTSLMRLKMLMDARQDRRENPKWCAAKREFSAVLDLYLQTDLHRELMQAAVLQDTPEVIGYERRA